VRRARTPRAAAVRPLPFERPLLRASIAVLAIAAAAWLTYQYWRLLVQADPIWSTSPRGGGDLRAIRNWTVAWFAGERLYEGASGALYPPATFALTWPVVGWLPPAALAIVWAGVCAWCLGWLALLAVRAGGARSPLERTLLACVPFSSYAAGAAIGNGQLTIVVIALLLAGLLRLARPGQRRRDEFVGAALFLAALAKPSLSAPFFWLVVVLPRTWRPALLVVMGYAGLTLFAASFQPDGALVLVRGWLARATAHALYESGSTLHMGFGTLGAGHWLLPLSLLAAMGLGTWVWAHRDADVWILLGVTAFFARFWTYHGWYDDLLLFVPTVALFRVARRAPAAGVWGVTAGFLFAANVACTLAPGGLYVLPPPWREVYLGAQRAVWGTTLIFLLVAARRAGALSPAAGAGASSRPGVRAGGGRP